MIELFLFALYFTLKAAWWVFEITLKVIFWIVAWVFVKLENYCQERNDRDNSQEAEADGTSQTFYSTRR